MGLVDYIGRYWAGAEILYGAIIAMTFTSALREIPDVLEFAVMSVVWTALFCCIAWGLADGLFYLWEREYIVRQENRIIASSRSAAGNQAAVAMLGEQLDDSILRNVPRERRAELYEGLSRSLAGAADREKVTAREAGTLVLGTLVRSALAGLVIVAPFFLVDDLELALDASNLLGILLLFAVGYTRALDRDLASRLVNGLAAAMVGVIIAVITIALGG
jgi:VIT1/CCC1 family predicted Fe2+/Mn2+ transporter